MTAFLKDTAMAQKISALTEMGRFEIELAAYGIAYYEKNTMQYYVGGKREWIDQQAQLLRLRGLCPTKIHTLDRRIVDYAGVLETAELELKVDLAYQLQATYGAADYTLLMELAHGPASDGAWAALEQWRASMIGLFQPDALQLFAQTVEHCTIAKKLSPQHYADLAHWVAGQLRQVEAELLLPGKERKTFWGFAVCQPDSSWQYKVNANYNAIRQLWEETGEQRLLATPLWEKTYPYKPQQAVSQLRQQFLLDLQQVMKPDYLALLEQVQQQPSSVSLQQCQAVYGQMQSTAMQALLVHYAFLWGLNLEI